MSLVDSLKGRLSLPLIGSPLFIISVPDLVVAQCTAGVIGAMPSLNARPAEQFEEWVIEIKERLAAHDARHPERKAAPFAINLIVHKSNDRLEHDLAVCVRQKVPLIITSLGARPEVNQAVHAYGGHVLHDPSASCRRRGPGSTGRSPSRARSPTGGACWRPRRSAPTSPMPAAPSLPPRRRGRSRSSSR
jgi:NAD(P)H-dependent flavin oxidoreductase YrpB (nitropropane dioxygenase family)